MVKDDPRIEADLKQIYLQLTAMQDQLKVLITLIQGNGDPSHGLIVRVDRLEQWQKGIDEERAETKGDLKKIVLPIVQYAIVSAIVALVVLAATHNLIK